MGPQRENKNKEEKREKGGKERKRKKNIEKIVKANCRAPPPQAGWQTLEKKGAGEKKYIHTQNL